METRRFGFGDILREAGGLFGANAGFVAGVTAAVAAGYIALDLTLQADASSVPSLIVGIFVQYLVVERLLAERVSGTGRRYGALFVASLLGGLGIIAGLVLLVVPGLLLAAGWAASTGFIVVDRKGGAAALAASWRATAGSRWSIVLVMLVTYVPLFVALFGLMAVLGVFGGVPGIEGGDPMPDPDAAESPLAIVVTDIIVSVTSTWGWLLGATIYNLANPVRASFEEVFG